MEGTRLALLKKGSQLCPSGAVVKRSQFEWWEETLIALGIWVAMVLEIVPLLPRRRRRV